MKTFTKQYKKTNSVIVYLSQNKTIYKLNKSLDLLELNFNKNFKYPILIFHEKDFNINKVVKNENIHFVNVKFEIPDFLDKSKVPNMVLNHNVGYRHMCRFFSLLIFDFIKDFDYYMRLDDDSYILSDVSYDLFGFMNENKKDYAFRVGTFEHEKCVEKLEDFFINYLKNKNIKPKFLFENFHKSCWNRLGYYNNFHISKIEFWLRDDVNNFLKEIDTTGGFYFHRWGDAMIQTLAVQIFMEKNKVWQFLDFDYEHESNLGNNNFFGGLFKKNGKGKHCNRTFQKLLKIL
jgi:alpha 1,2-mannosyltransferase